MTWHITQHAIERAAERLWPALDAQDIRLRLLGMCHDAHYVKTLESGADLWRGPKPMRIRMYVRSSGDTQTLQSVVQATDEHGMMPLQVTAVMASRLLYGQTLPYLDGIVSAGCFRLLSPEQQSAMPLPCETDWLDDLDLPFERWESNAVPVSGSDTRLWRDGKLWGWKASEAMLPADYGHTKMAYRQPVAWQAFNEFSQKASLTTNAGRFKPSDLVMPGVTCRNVFWFCVGDPVRLRLALNQVTAIGKKTGTGGGKVQEWIVAHHTDADAWKHRRMPSPEGNGQWFAIRPPYHRSERLYPCL